MERSHLAPGDSMSRPTAAFSATLEVDLAHEPGTLGRLCTAIGDVGGNIRSLRGFSVTGGSLREEVVVDAASEAHVEEICEAVDGLEGIKVISAVDRTFKIHEGGKLETISRIPLRDADDLSMAYTPGVARVCMAIHEDESASHELTIRKNTVAIVSDGTAVLGLGDIGSVTWGSNLYWASNDAALLTGSWWTFIPTGLSIATVSFALTLINFGIDEVSNPRVISERLWRIEIPKYKINHGITPVFNPHE